MSSDDNSDFDLSQALGASGAPSQQMLMLFIPDRDRDGVELGTQRRWVLEAAALLSQIGGGVTIPPAVEGGWLDELTGSIVWERPVLVYTHVLPERFFTELPRLRGFLHRLGHETRQGEIAVRFGDEFFRITEFAELGP